MKRLTLPLDSEYDNLSKAADALESGCGVAMPLIRDGIELALMLDPIDDIDTQVQIYWRMRSYWPSNVTDALYRREGTEISEEPLDTALLTFAALFRRFMIKRCRLNCEQCSHVTASKGSRFA